MEAKLIVNSENENNKMMKEIKTMHIIKYLNLLIALLRFILMFFLIALIPYFPALFKPRIFTGILFLHTLIFPIITIYLLITLISGTIQRDFWVRKKTKDMSICHLCCCCCLMSKNVVCLKNLSFYFTIVSFLWSSLLLFYEIDDPIKSNNRRFFPNESHKVRRKIFLHYVDTLLLFIHSYIFYYFEYFLSRVKIYLELYKRLIIKNRNKEAEFVRENLPEQIYNYEGVDDPNERELQNI